jgi:hypothetical protein
MLRKMQDPIRERVVVALADEVAVLAVRHLLRQPAVPGRDDGESGGESLRDDGVQRLLHVSVSRRLRWLNEHVRIA